MTSIRSARLVGVVALLMMLCSLVGCENKEQKAVRASFDLWDYAGNTRDAETVWRLTAPADREYYGRIVDMARYASEDEVRALRPILRMAVLSARLRFEKDELKSLDAKGYIFSEVRNGNYGEDEDDEFRYSLGEITVTGDTASGWYLENRKNVGAVLDFIKVDGEWKVDTNRLDDYWDQQIREGAREMGMGVDEYIAESIEFFDGVSVTEATWKPPFKR